MCMKTALNINFHDEEKKFDNKEYFYSRAKSGLLQNKAENSSQWLYIISTKISCGGQLSVSRDNGKTSLLGVDPQRSYLSEGICQDEKIGKWN